MPLFGSKKNTSSSSGEKKPSYPTQASYPTQQAAAAAPLGYDAPPPYSVTAAPTGGQPSQGYPPMGFIPIGYHQELFGGPPQTVVVEGGFDAGARFDGPSKPNIPPPPPGCMPNAAQMAAAHGHSVVVTQQKSSVWTGGSDGGYTFF